MKRLIKKIFEPAGFVVRVMGKSSDDQVGTMDLRCSHVKFF